MKAIKQVFGSNLQQYTMVLVMVLLAIAFDIASHGKMLTSSNFQNLITGNVYVLILAIGMVMVIVIGQIDLSVGSVAGFVGMMVGISVNKWGWGWFAALLLGLGIGILVGMWHGWWLSQVGIPGFIVTLAGMMIFRGLIIWVSGSISQPVPSQFSTLGSGYLGEWGPNTTLNNSTLLLGLIGIAWFVFSELNRRKHQLARGVDSPMWVTATRIGLIALVIGYLTYLFGSGRVGTSFPIPGVILLVLVIIYHVITQRTTFGRHIYAVGGNRAAAALSGVNTKRTYFLVMANMSFLAAIAGILAVGHSTAAGPADGTGWELDAIAAVFIGGAAVSGGIGTVIGSMVGGLVMAVLNSGLMLMGVGSEKTQVIKGLVLLAAVAFDVLNKQQGRPSIIGKLMGNRTKSVEERPVADEANPPVETADLMPTAIDLSWTS